VRDDGGVGCDSTVLLVLLE